MRQNPANLELTRLDLIENPTMVHNIVKAAVTQIWRALDFASIECKGIPEIVHAAVKKNGLAIYYANQECKGNPEIVLTAVKQNGLALEFARLDLIEDSTVVRNIVLTAVKKKGLVFNFVDSSFRADSDIVKAAATKDGYTTLQYARLDLIEDPKVVDDIVLTAVKQNGLALQFANDEHKENPEIVEAAVRQNGLVIGFVNNDFREANPLLT